MSGWTETGCLDAIDGSALAVGTDGERFRLSFSSPDGRKAVIDLSAEAWDQFLELAARAAMPRQAAPDVHGPHECSFPCNPPGGTFWNPGPCKTCGKPYVVAQAEAQLAEAQAALAEAHAVAERRAEAGRRDGHGEADGG